MLRSPRRVGAGKDVFGLGPILQLAGEAGCGGDGGISGRGAPSAYRRDSASVGLNAQRLVFLQPVRCHQASAAIARDLFLDGP